MGTLVTATVPADELALSETLAEVPEASFGCESVGDSGEEVAMPLLWAWGTDREEVEAALGDDPTVDDATLLANFDDEWLYWVEWVEEVALVVWMITNHRATLMAASTDGGEWALRILYPERDDLVRTAELCEDHGLTFDVRSIREMEGGASGRYGLTDGQYQALTIACRRGYFSIPRECDLDDLANEMDISHQALSERLRRGIESLVRDALLVGDGTVETVDTAE